MDQLIKKVKEYTAGKNLSSDAVNSWLTSLITTIESQKEEIEKYRREAMNERELGESIVAEREQLYIEIESLKAITELAVKGLKELQRYTAPDYPFKTAETIAEFHTLIGLTLAEIERLSQ